MASSGRKPLSELEKAKRKAARGYRKIAEKRSLTYDDIYSKRAGEKHMGRKPVAKSEQVRRAKVDFLESLEDYRAAANNDHVELPAIRALLRELRAYRANDSAGRKSADRVIILYKYIEKERDKVSTAQLKPCPLEAYTGRGRKPMSREEKMQHHLAKIREAEKEIEELIKDAPESQRIYYSLRSERLELRSLKKAQKKNPHDQMVQNYLHDCQDSVNQLEKKYKAQLALEKKSNLAIPVTNSAIVVSNSATPVSNLTKALSNSTTAVSSPENTCSVAEVPANLNPHDSIELMKKRQEELNEEMATLDELERVLRQKAQVLKQQRELEEAIAAKKKEALR